MTTIKTIAKSDIRPITPDELAAVCKSTKTTQDGLTALRPYAHATEPLMLMPAFEPSKLDKAAGWTYLNFKTGEIGHIAGHGIIGLNNITPETDTILYCDSWFTTAAAASIGYAAISSSCGLYIWRSEWLPLFKDKTVYIVFGKDLGSLLPAEKLYGTAKEIRIVDLCSCGVIRDPRDITAEDFKQLIDNASIYTPLPPEQGADPSTPTGSPYIVLDDDHPDTIAEAFESDSPAKHRYNSTDLWSIFSDNKYQIVPDEREIELYIRQFIATKIRIKSKKKQDDGSFKDITLPPDKKLKTAGNIANIMVWLRDTPGVHLMPSQTAPCSLDGKLNPKYIIALNNGLLDWSSYPYTLHEHTKEYYNLNYLPYDWQGEKDSELWIKFLVDATGGDVELFEFLQQWAGYCLMKHDQREQKFVIIIGESGTGKSVFIDVLTHLLGKENVSTVPLEKFDDPHFVSQTYGKMLNITDESESHLEESIETHLKHYTGGTMYTFKRLYANPFSAYPTAKMMIVTNHLPSFKDTSDAIWRRLIVAPFENVVPTEKIIKGLADKIIATEMPGVLKWALEGARKLEKFGFTNPEICQKTLTEYRREAIPEMQFLEEHFEASDAEDDRISCKEFRDRYEAWCKEQGIMPKSQKKLIKTIKKMYPLCERNRSRWGGERDYYYFGIKSKV